jgi:hypothetical protein
MNRMIWGLPAWAYNFMLRLTGWRLVRLQSGAQPMGYRWTRAWPL